MINFSKQYQTFRFFEKEDYQGWYWITLERTPEGWNVWEKSQAKDNYGGACLDVGESLIIEGAPLKVAFEVLRDCA